MLLLSQTGRAQDSRNGNEETSTPSKTPSQQNSANMETPKRQVERKESFPLASPGPSERSDAESDAESTSSFDTPLTPRIESASKEDIVAMFRKQERVLIRYKTRFSEVRDSMLIIMYLNFSRKQHINNTSTVVCKGHV